MFKLDVYLSRDKYDESVSAITEVDLNFSRCKRLILKKNKDIIQELLLNSINCCVGIIHRFDVREHRHTRHLPFVLGEC